MKKMINKKQNVVHWALLSLLCMLPALGHASNVESIINSATGYLTGSVAKGLAGLAIIGMGYFTLFTNKFPKEMFVMALVGSGMIFGGAEIFKRWIA